MVTALSLHDRERDRRARHDRVDRAKAAPHSVDQRCPARRLAGDDPRDARSQSERVELPEPLVDAPCPIPPADGTENAVGDAPTELVEDLVGDRLVALLAEWVAKCAAADPGCIPLRDVPIMPLPQLRHEREDVAVGDRGDVAPEELELTLDDRRRRGRQQHEAAQPGPSRVRRQSDSVVARRGRENLLEAEVASDGDRD
jgi:hypothetical protein